MRLVSIGSFSQGLAAPAAGLLLPTNPARLLNVAAGTLSEGAVADISVLAPDLPVTVDPSKFRSKARNTPFAGWHFKGGVAATIVGGRTVYVNESAAGAERFQ